MIKEVIPVNDSFMMANDDGIGFASFRFPTVTVVFVGNLSEPAELGPFSLFHAELGIVSAPKFQMFMEVL
jgi:hypothetical protein